MAGGRALTFATAVAAAGAVLVAGAGAAGAHPPQHLAPVTHADGSWLSRLPEQRGPRGGLLGRALRGRARAQASPLTVLNSLP